MGADINEEEGLLKLLKSGSEAAFTRLYQLYVRQLYAKTLKMVHDKDIAQEIIQDIFLKIWERRSQIDLEKSFKAYLYTIGVNLVYDHFRKLAKDTALQNSLLSAAEQDYTCQEDKVISQEQLALIQGAIEQLSPQRKRVYMMCKLDGKTYAEVSRELNISLSTIQDHMVKANIVLKNYLKNHPDMAIYAVTLSIIASL